MRGRERAGSGGERRGRDRQEPPGRGVRSRARARGAGVLWGRCWEAGGAPAYWPWVQALRARRCASFGRECGARSLWRRDSGARSSSPRSSVLATRMCLSSATSESEGARFRLFDSMATFLREHGRGEPVVLVLDDLHVADLPRCSCSSSWLGHRGRARDAGRDLPNPALERGRRPTKTFRAEQEGGRRIALAGLSAPDVASYVDLGGRSHRRATVAEAIFVRRRETRSSSARSFASSRRKGARRRPVPPGA